MKKNPLGVLENLFVHIFYESILYHQKENNLFFLSAFDTINMKKLISNFKEILEAKFIECHYSDLDLLFAKTYLK